MKTRVAADGRALRVLLCTWGILTVSNMRTRTQRNSGLPASNLVGQEFAHAIDALKRGSLHADGERTASPPTLVFAYNPKRDVISSMGEDHGFLDYLDAKTVKTLVVGMLVGSPKFIPETADITDGFVIFNLDVLNNSDPDAVVKAARHLRRFMNPEKQVNLQGNMTWQIAKRFGGQLPQTLRELAPNET
jgi:hypothetical protein